MLRKAGRPGATIYACSTECGLLGCQWSLIVKTAFYSHLRSACSHGSTDFISYKPSRRWWYVVSQAGPEMLSVGYTTTEDILLKHHAWHPCRVYIDKHFALCLTSMGDRPACVMLLCLHTHRSRLMCLPWLSAAKPCCCHLLANICPDKRHNFFLAVISRHLAWYRWQTTKLRGRVPGGAGAL